MARKLPMGWVETTPIGIELDAGTPEDEWKSTANPRKPRTEIRRWIRGARYVRICEITDEKEENRFAVHNGIRSRPKKDDDNAHYADESDAEQYAMTLMARGGY